MPATEEDFRTRPGYISINNGGKQVCDKRLMYLASKGALLKKRQRLESEFCKFASSEEPTSRARGFTSLSCLLTQEARRRSRFQVHCNIARLGRGREPSIHGPGLVTVVAMLGCNH